MSRRITPVKVRAFRQFLKSIGCIYLRTEGDHEIWTKTGLNRPVVFPTKHKELTVFFIKNNLKTLGIADEEFLKLL